jgi:hypothetical protein
VGGEEAGSLVKLRQLLQLFEELLIGNSSNFGLQCHIGVLH